MGTIKVIGKIKKGQQGMDQSRINTVGVKKNERLLNSKQHQGNGGPLLNNQRARKDSQRTNIFQAPEEATY